MRTEERPDTDLRVTVGSAGMRHRPDHARRDRPPPWLLVTILVAVVAMVLTLVDGGAEEPDLGAELPPPEAQLSLPRAGPLLADGWRRLDLPGGGTALGASRGPNGWTVIVAAPRSVLWRSQDGVTWHAVRLPSEARLGFEADVADAGGRLVVASTTRREGVDTAVAWAWTPEDGQWTRLEVGGGEEASIHGLSGAASAILAFGSVEGSATIWRLEGDRFVTDPFGLEGPPGSSVTAVLAAEPGILAFGQSPEGPLAWRQDGGVWRRRAVLAGFEPLGFVDVAQVERSGQLVGAVGPSRPGSVSTLVRATEWRTWLRADAGPWPVVALVSGRGEVMALLTESFGMGFLAVTADGSSWVPLYPGQGSPLEDSFFADGILGDELGLLVGSHRFRPALWTRGGVGPPELAG